MPASVRIWLEVAHHQAFRIGGWAFLRLHAGDLRGVAGGARRVDLEQTSLMAVAAALADLAEGAEADLRTASAPVLDVTGRIAAGEPPPHEDRDLWTKAAAALQRVRLVVRGADEAPGGPAAFAAAWADFGRDRAKDKGAFSAPIPKSHLAKAGV